MHDCVSEHDILQIQSKKVFIIWVISDDSDLEMAENGASDSNQFVGGGSWCLRFSFVEKLGHVMYQNLKFVHFRSLELHFRSI